MSKWIGYGWRHKALVACGAILATVALTAALAPDVMAQGSAQAANRPAVATTPAVLVLGDSLSAEYGIARGTGWVSLLQDRLRTERFDYSVVNASISGETTIGGKTRLPDLLKRHKPAIVVVELGANDGLRGLPLPSIESNLRSILNDAQKAGAGVLLVGMRIPPNFGQDYTERFFALYPKLATEYRAGLVPFFLDKVITRPDWFQDDRIHPTSAAQLTLLDNVWPQLKPLLKTHPKPR
ncbi:acyl-CoA thioesterase-1 [Cupriavidus sp. YR651]|nr:acyl-CoA thioesterase-1 [Cupriavidus sp. YR651]